MEKIRNHFDKEAEEFDKFILKLIPHYKEMIHCLISSIPFNTSYRIKIIDIGCGTGTIGKAIKNKFYNSHIICLDFAQNMIEMAKIKLANYKNVDFEVQDFCKYNFDDKFNIIISSLSLHHILSSDDKIKFYEKVYDSLLSGGLFYNADLVLGSNEYLHNIYMEKWKLFMSKNFSHKEIENERLPNHREQDSPAKLLDHIKWLEQIGFTSVDVLWKYYNFAVYGGHKI